jgi:hypothetical protein
MPEQSQASFEWLSPLGASVTLFLMFGTLNVFVGVLTPFLIRADAISSGGMLFSERSDAVVFGGRSSELVRADRALGCCGGYC